MEKFMQEQISQLNSRVRDKSGYRVDFACGEEEIREIQRLRYQVFAAELGARLSCRIPGHDSDLYDHYCEHLVVRAGTSQGIVGACRVLSPGAARQVGAYNAEGDFDLSSLENLRPQMIEVGRSCIHPDHRSDAVVTLLWAALAEYMVSRGCEHLIGCASIGMADGGHNAANLFQQLSPAQIAPIGFRTHPFDRLPYERLADGAPVLMPAWIKGYLRAGAWVCGELAWDPDFNTAQVLLHLPLSRWNTGYALPPCQRRPEWQWT
jgi:putative hemolysin